MFNLVSGVAMLAASVVASWAWDRLGPAATFWIGALFATFCRYLPGGIGATVTHSHGRLSTATNHSPAERGFHGRQEAPGI